MISQCWQNCELSSGCVEFLINAHPMSFSSLPRKSDMDRYAGVPVAHVTVT